jgi:tetratricopeptide (TPR) repeat protein
MPEVRMSLPMLLLLEGCLYIVLFGGLSLLRREGLSTRFAIESIAITLIVAGLAYWIGFYLHPIVFLIGLYLVTMRVRLLVDLGNFLARRKRFNQASQVYTLARRAWPDQASALIVQLNQGAALLQQDRLDDAVDTFTGILQKGQSGYLGVKYEAATHFNLAVAYRRKGIPAQATREFNAVIETWPGSEYARRAEAALKREHS